MRSSGVQVEWRRGLLTCGCAMKRLGLVLAGVLAGGGVLIAQQISGVDAPAKAQGYVVYAAEPQVVKAGKPAVLELQFRGEGWVPCELAYAEVGAADSYA